MAVQRINFLNVPIDILQDEDIEDTVLELLSRKTPQQIIFMSIWDVLKARRQNEFRSMVENAALCLPVSNSIINGAKFLKKDIPIKRQQFSVIINFLNVIDSHYKSLYLFGGRKESLLEAEKNVKATFKGIRLVGRFTGYYNKSIEQNIISAIHKAEPSIVILSNGISGGQKWIYRNRNKFTTGIFIYDNQIIDIFSKFKKRQSEAVFNSKFFYFFQILKNPFRIFNIFKYIWFKLLLITYRIRKL